VNGVFRGFGRVITPMFREFPVPFVRLHHPSAIRVLGTLPSGKAAFKAKSAQANVGDYRRLL
jgi:hypothetical protein